jgi:hypothetical protein
MRLGQTTLARLWAELLSRLEADLPPDERTAAVFLAKALAAEGRRPEAWEALSESARRGAADEVHRYALALRGDVRKAKSPHVENVRVHYDKLCRSPIAEENLRICWQAQAWLAEADGDFAEARRTLDRISRRFDQPVPLVTFFQRHGRCRRIEAQLAQLEPGTASYDRVKAILRNCTPAFE